MIEVVKRDISVKFEFVSREQFVTTPIDKGDQFANTFVAKADLLKLWPVLGILDVKGQVKSAVAFTISKRKPLVANLQLLHTFDRHRRLGLASELVRFEYNRIANLAEYFRVSSEEDSVGFYRSLGLRFWGKQKSGTFLCMHRITSSKPEEGVYDRQDRVIQSALFSGRRGCLVEEFDYSK